MICVILFLKNKEKGKPKTKLHAIIMLRDIPVYYIYLYNLEETSINPDTWTQVEDKTTSNRERLVI